MVCAIARTGSNLLTDGLRSTRRAGRPMQFFLPKFEERYGSRHGLSPGADFPGYIRGIVEGTKTENEVSAFKVMGWYLEEFLQRLRGSGAFGGLGAKDTDLLRRAFPRIRYVQILRRNKLRQAISKAKATQTGLWKIRGENAAAAQPQFDEGLITRCLADTAADEEIWNIFFRRNGIEPFVVQYEDLCQDYEATIRRVLNHLKIRMPASEKIAPPQTIRQTDSLSREWEERYLALHPSAAETLPSLTA
jgi:LPS sulfotransferase NodH